MAFCHEAVTIDPAVTQGSLESFIGHCRNFPFGGTYCELPILYALRNNIKTDVFVIYTDCETSWSSETPASALKRYRAEMDIPDAKMVVVATTSNGFTLADPCDPGMFDVAGFDPAVTSLISEFVKGEL